MQNLYNDLEKLLKQDERLFAEGKILKNKVSELAIKLDAELIDLLFRDKQANKHFFIEVAGKFVFNQDRFLKFINNKEFLPDSFTAFKNHIGLAEGDDYLKDSGKVILAWPYKDCVLEGGQDKEDAKRNEIFYNETLAPDEIDRLFEPKVLTNFKKIDKTGEHKVDQISEQDNLIIKGNNLLALHSLKKKYQNKVKLIYIDPPFNRKADTFYNDKFKHSTWLTFMKSRLEVAKRLLNSEGFICVHLSDSEMGYCKVLMDEVFGRDNYRNTIALTTNDPSGFKATGESIFSTANYILIYSKDEKKPKIKKFFIETGYDKMYNKVLLNRNAPIKDWRWKDIGEIVAHQNKFKNKKEARKQLGENFDIMIAEFALENANKVFRTAAIQGGARKKRLAVIEKSLKIRDKVFVHPNDDIKDFYILNGEGIVFYENKIVEIEGKKLSGSLITDVWTDISWNGIANEGGVKLKNGKKPEKLMARIIDMFSNKGDLILDFHLGSGTTAAVAHKMSRKYIGIEQIDYEGNDSFVRLNNVIKGEQGGISKSENWKGGGSFIYAELKQWNEAYIQVIQEAKTTKELMAIYKKMRAEAFFRYEIDLSKFDEKRFAEIALDDQKKVLMECLDKNHLYVNYGEMEDATYKIPAEEKKINKAFYGN